MAGVDVRASHVYAHLPYAESLAGQALLEYVLDGKCHNFERAKSTPYSLVNPDGSRYTVFAGLDPPPPPAVAFVAAT